MDGFDSVFGEPIDRALAGLRVLERVPAFALARITVQDIPETAKGALAADGAPQAFLLRCVPHGLDILFHVREIRVRIEWRDADEPCAETRLDLIGRNQFLFGRVRQVALLDGRAHAVGVLSGLSQFVVQGLQFAASLFGDEHDGARFEVQDIVQFRKLVVESCF